MPRFSRIENRCAVCLSANRLLVDEAKEKKLNLSLIFNEALKRTLNVEGEDARIKAVEIRMASMDEYINKKDLKGEYNNWRWNEKGVEKNVVVSKEKERNVRQAITDIETS